MGVAETAARRGLRLTPEQKTKLEQYECGCRLAPVLKMPGWQDVKDMIAIEVEAAQRRLLSSNDPDLNTLVKLQARFQAAKDLERSLFHSIDHLVLAAETAPEFIEANGL
jgi:hypothetical protein